MKFVEVNFDGLVGPTHNYAGLAFGNVASISNAQIASHPKKAALQGLAKMQLLMRLGIPQAVLPPHPRPNIALLKNIGFDGTVAKIISNAESFAQNVFFAAYSASSMWAANAATVSPAPNTIDEKTHITPANLCANLHRQQEADVNYKIFKQIFKDENYFIVHKPLPSVQCFSDEGAANHSYICSDYNKEGIELFVYGKKTISDSTSSTSVKSSDALKAFAKDFATSTDKDSIKNPIKYSINSSQKYPARQTLEASKSVARLHKSKDRNTLFLQQAPNAIDHGVFHNDVVFVANKNVIFYHQAAFYDTDIKLLKKLVLERLNNDAYFLEITETELSLVEAVASYIFNSQIVSLPNSRDMAIIAPKETENSPYAKKIINKILAMDNPIQKAYFVDCKESMQNGGGPACLRLRVCMPEAGLKKLHGNILLTESLYNDLVAWVNYHYRDTLTLESLLDEKLYYESKVAMEELQKILNLECG